MNNAHLFKPCGCHLVQYEAEDNHGSTSVNMTHYKGDRLIKMVPGYHIYTYECCQRGQIGQWFPCQGGGYRCIRTYWTVTQCLQQDFAHIVYDRERHFLIPTAYAPPTGPDGRVTDEQFAEYKKHALVADDIR